MKFFRRTLPVEQAQVRRAEAQDLVGVQHLYRVGGRRYLGCSPDDVPALLAARPAVALAAGAELWGVMLTGWGASVSSWLRGVALAEGVPAADALRRLFPALCELLRADRLRKLFYAGDETTDRWLQPALAELGFVADTDVVVYEKRDLYTPSVGNRAVRLRSAYPVDLHTVLELDQRCFADQWIKGQEIIGPALRDAPFFVIAEIDETPVAYAFATAHFNGRLLHLVRIAVDPARQGQAIAVRLLSDLVAFAARAEAEAITLNTQADNLHAQRLYRWFGFQPTGERQTVLRYDL
jgi:ribosomal protein S18 acetylase RimI-like enzyme